MKFILLFLITQKSTKPEDPDDKFDDIYEIPKEFTDSITLSLINRPCFLEWSLNGKLYKVLYNYDTINENPRSFGKIYPNDPYKDPTSNQVDPDKKFIKCSKDMFGIIKLNIDKK